MYPSAQADEVYMDRGGLQGPLRVMEGLWARQWWGWLRRELSELPEAWGSTSTKGAQSQEAGMTWGVGDLCVHGLGPLHPPILGLTLWPLPTNSHSPDPVAKKGTGLPSPTPTLSCHFLGRRTSSRAASRAAGSQNAALPGT